MAVGDFLYLAYRSAVVARQHCAQVTSRENDGVLVNGFHSVELDINEQAERSIHRIYMRYDAIGH